jgi:hypothetical protein
MKELVIFIFFLFSIFFGRAGQLFMPCSPRLPNANIYYFLAQLLLDLCHWWRPNQFDTEGAILFYNLYFPNLSTLPPLSRTAAAAAASWLQGAGSWWSRVSLSKTRLTSFGRKRKLDEQNAFSLINAFPLTRNKTEKCSLSESCV